MMSFKQVVERIRANPDDPGLAVLRDLVIALDTDAAFELDRIYELKHADFDLALCLLKDWRIVGFLQPRGTLTRSLAEPAREVSLGA